jgi:Phage integrase, N-terminal SAM-like domain
VEKFGEYATGWLESAVHLSEGTRSKYQQHLKTHILPTFGERDLVDVQPSHVQRWVAALVRGGSSPGTVGTVYRTFATIMRSAEINRVIERSPCIGVKLPRDDDRREMKFLDPEEIERLGWRGAVPARGLRDAEGDREARAALPGDAGHRAVTVARQQRATRDRHPIFALLGANAVSQVGNAMTIMAGAWFVLETTGSAAKVGLVSAALGVAAIVRAVLGGPLVDRMGFRRWPASWPT